MAGQVDRFGQPIPNDPGYQVIINPDGSQPQMRNTLRLATGLVASDDPSSQATLLTSTGGSGGGIYPISASTVDITGATPVNATWPALLATLMAQGYEGIDQTGAILKFDSTQVLIPTRAENVGFRVIGGTYDGTAAQNGPFGPFIRPSIALEYPFVAGYGPRNWTQTITIGLSTFVGVADVSGLHVGDTVFVRLGADPSNEDGPFVNYYAKITAIAGSNVTVDKTTPELPIDIPSWNVNTFRIPTEHDMYKVTGFQDNLSFESPILESVSFISGQTRRESHLNPTIISGSAPYRLDQCFEYLHVSPHFNTLTPYNGVGYSADFGFCYTNYGSVSVEIRDFYCDDIRAEGGVWDDETQSRGIRFTGLTYAVFNNTSFGASTSAFWAGANTAQEITIEHLVAGGGPNAALCNGNISVRTLEIIGALNVLGLEMSRIGTIRISGKNGAEWKNVESDSFFMAPPSNATTDFPIPRHGLLSGLQIYASTLTGVTDVLLVRQDTGTNSIKSLMSTGTWGSIDTLITNLDNGFSLANLANSGGYDGDSFKVRFVTDGTLPAGAFFNANVKTLLRLRNTLGNGYIDTSIPQIVGTNGAPSANASFLGQVAFDVVDKKYYDAVSVGSGSSDWVLRGGSASAITSLTGDGTASGPGAAAFTLAAVGSASTVGSATQVCQVTTDGKGRVTDKTAVTIAIPSSAITDATAAGIAMLDAATAVAQAALLGSTIPTAGTNIPDADTTVSLAGGAHYIMPTATAARIVTLGTSGSPSTGEVILIDFTRTGAFAVTVKDDAGTTLFQVPASVKMTLTASWDGAHFSNARAIRIQ